eukprot:998200-Pelagomonas_calceolata.AAC.2
MGCPSWHSTSNSEALSNCLRGLPPSPVNSDLEVSAAPRTHTPANLEEVRHVLAQARPLPQALLPAQSGSIPTSQSTGVSDSSSSSLPGSRESSLEFSTSAPPELLSNPLAAEQIIMAPNVQNPPISHGEPGVDDLPAFLHSLRAWY